MQNQTPSSTKEARMTAARKLLASSEATESIMRFLADEALLSEMEVLAHLAISPRTLLNWKAETPAENSKYLRLIRLKEVVEKAVASDIPAAHIKQLLVAPLDASDDTQQSILHVIRAEPDFAFFSQMTSMLVTTFSLRRSENPTFRLRPSEYKRLQNDLEQAPKANEYLQKVKAKYKSSKR